MAPKPYYQDDHCTIYHGDCREVLPHIGPVDLVVTDPPYGIGEARGKNRSRSNPFAGGSRVTHARKYASASWDDEPPPSWIFGQIRDVSRHQVIFGGNYFPLPPSSCWLVWDKDNGECDFADCELAWTNLKKAVRRKRYRWAGMLQEPGRKKDVRSHPTQKPVEVMAWAIRRAPDDCALILDPFMGSGTTLRAAKDLGRKSIGIEISKEYCDIAVRRLAQEVLF